MGQIDPKERLRVNSEKIENFSKNKICSNVIDLFDESKKPRKKFKIKKKNPKKKLKNSEKNKTKIRKKIFIKK